MRRLAIWILVLAACGKSAHTFEGLPPGGACSDFDDGVAQCAGSGQLFTCVYAGNDRAVCATGTVPRVQHDTTVMPMPVPVYSGK
jgi:hypothetical protein